MDVKRKEKAFQAQNLSMQRPWVERNWVAWKGTSIAPKEGRRGRGGEKAGGRRHVGSQAYQELRLRLLCSPSVWSTVGPVESSVVLPMVLHEGRKVDEMVLCVPAAGSCTTNFQGRNI